MVGGIAVDANGPHALIATAGGTPIAQTLTGVANGLSEASGAKVPVEDVVPLTADDPTGAGLTALALPLVFGGIMPAVVLVQLFPRSIVKRVLGAAGVAVVAGFALTAILQFGTNSLDGNYLLTALALTMGMSAISLPILGLESLLDEGIRVGRRHDDVHRKPTLGYGDNCRVVARGLGRFGAAAPTRRRRSIRPFDGVLRRPWRHHATSGAGVLDCRRDRAVRGCRSEEGVDPRGRTRGCAGLVGAACVRGQVGNRPDPVNALHGQFGDHGVLVHR